MSSEETKPSDPPPPYVPPMNPPATNTAPYPTGPPNPNAAPYPTGTTPYPPNTAPYPAGYAQPTVVQTGVVGYQQPARTTVVVAGGNCPNCRVSWRPLNKFSVNVAIGSTCKWLCPLQVGMMHEQFSCCGILLAIIFFPLGIICCLMMRIQVCSNCGTVVG